MFLLYTKKRSKEYRRIKRNIIYTMAALGTFIVLIVFMFNIRYNNDDISLTQHYNNIDYTNYKHISRHLLATDDNGCEIINGTSFCGNGDKCSSIDDCNKKVNGELPEYKCVLNEYCVDVNVKYKLPGVYPTEVFTYKQLRQGAVILYIIGVFYTFLAIAIICDEFFVPAIDVVVEKLNMSPNTAGATFMAAGGSAPELFTSFIGTFISRDSVGFGTIVGSAVFNVLFVIGCCAVASLEPLQLTWYPFARDCIYYSISLLVLGAFFLDGLIYVWEALILLLLYVGYVTLMMYNEKLYTYLDEKFSLSKDAKQQRDRAESQVIIRTKTTVSFHISLFKLMTKDSTAADLAGIYLMKMDKGDIRDTFRQVDSDGNGYIDRKELKTVLKRLGNSDISDDELEECYKELDKNGDGKIDFDEFQHWFLRSRAKMTADIDQIFDKYDRDGDGEVDRSECKQLIKDLQGDIKDANTTKNGGSDNTDNNEAKDLEAEVDEALTVLDKNKDGKISKDEFIDWYKKSAFFDKKIQKQKSTVDALETTAEEEEGIDLSMPEGCLNKINWLITLPIIIPFVLTIPDTRIEKWKKILAIIINNVYGMVSCIFMVNGMVGNCIW